MAEFQSEFQSRFKTVELFQSEPIGSGAYGVVCKAKCDELWCAAKLLHQTFVATGQSWITDKFLQECAFLASIKHPNIVQFLGVHRDDSGQPVLLMELLDENLTHFLESFESSSPVPLHLQVDLSHDISLAIQYLHSHEIIHRDLSSNNVLLVAGQRAKITDFGMSKLSSSSTVMLSKYTQVPGCPVYMPPEAWLNPPIYTEKLDIFSFGVLLLQIITTNTPSPGPQDVLINDKRSPTGFLKLPVPETQRRSTDLELVQDDHKLKPMILKCLSDKDAERPASEELCQSLDNLKKSVEYQKSSDETADTTDTANTTDTVDSEVSELKKLVASLREQVEQKNEEVSQLQDEVTNLRSAVRNLEDELDTKDSEIKQLKEQLKKKPTKNRVEHESINSNSKTLYGFSPEVLKMISRSRDVGVYHIHYDFEKGSVKIFYHNLDDISQTVRVFFKVYQHFFNTGQLRVGFIPVPASFPTQLLEKTLKLCHLDHIHSMFQLIEEAQVIKVVARNPEEFQSSTDHITDQLNLNIALPSNRKLAVKGGSILDEEVSIIVSAAEPGLGHRWGVAAAINAASDFEVQKHADEYISKYGPVDVGSIALTKAGGSLKCDWIIHAVGTSGVFAGQTSVDKRIVTEIKQVLKNLVTKILKKAEELEATSIAMPAIGTGSLGLDSKIAADALIEGVLEYEFQSDSSIKSIRIVILLAEMLSIFAETLINRRSNASSPGVCHFQSLPRLPPSKSSPSSSSTTTTKHTQSYPSANSSCKHQ